MTINGKKNWRPGQLLLPSLLVVPSLLLFVYLLFETTKVSREKIRQQFAVDSAAFIQMGDYTNLLNRTAYVNGAFPYRIFKEAYECPPEKPMKKTNTEVEICPYDMLYEAGAFPKYKNDVKGAEPKMLDPEPKWEIEFGPARPEFANNPTSSVSKPVFDLITWDQGNYIYIEWGQAIGYYKFYSQVYTLLGSVEESQWTVFERLTDNFNFFRKSYYLNANTQECVDNPQTCGNDGLNSSGGFISNKLRKGSNFFMHYVLKLMFYGKVYTGGMMPYYLGKPPAPIDMTSMNPNGLFQLASVSDSVLDKLGTGLEVYQGWDAPNNYFNVPLNVLGKCKETGRPCVHARITSQCPQLKNGNNCVWPAPTPKYQTRLYP
ncbi:MAG: hypothetical protein HY952_01020 [Elusimicrobia bacterium]|jgi:hypothetical protein|nr:hypothetical protein [Elusimicrobiota bacterium]